MVKWLKAVCPMKPNHDEGEHLQVMFLQHCRERIRSQLWCWLTLAMSSSHAHDILYGSPPDYVSQAGSSRRKQRSKHHFVCSLAEPVSLKGFYDAWGKSSVRFLNTRSFQARDWSQATGGIDWQTGDQEKPTLVLCGAGGVLGPQVSCVSRETGCNSSEWGLLGKLTCKGRWKAGSLSLSSSSTFCLPVTMATSPSVSPYGEAGRLEDILEGTKEEKIMKPPHKSLMPSLCG